MSIFFLEKIDSAQSNSSQTFLSTYFLENFIESLVPFLRDLRILKFVEIFQIILDV